jgi:hypothetical protein
LISGSGTFRSAHLYETISYALGTAYVITSDDEEHVNMHYFRDANIKNCADEDVPVFHLEKVGGWALRESVIT